MQMSEDDHVAVIEDYTDAESVMVESVTRSKQHSKANQSKKDPFSMDSR